MKVATAKKTFSHSREKRKLKSIMLNTGATVDWKRLSKE